MIEEIFPNVLDVVRSGLLQAAQATCGQNRHHAAAVFFAALACNETAFHQTIETSRESAGGETQRIGEVAHAHRPAVGFGEVNQNLVITQCEPVFGKPGLECGRQVSDALDECAPCDGFCFVQPTRM